MAAVQDSDPNRQTRTTSEFVSQLTAGAIKGATTSAMLYGMWYGMPTASSLLGGELAMLFSGSVISTLDFTKLSAGAGYLFTAVQGLIGVSETVSIASGYNWVLENIFGGNIDNYNDVTTIIDGISLSVIAMGIENHLNRPKGELGKKFSDMTSDKALKVAEEYAKKSPIKFPEGATMKPASKTGYEQITYKWNDGTYKYEVRWHTRTPDAPTTQVNTWVVQRTVPGNGGTPPKSYFKIGSTGTDADWIEGWKWFDAIAARKAGTATAEQTRILDSGHWKE